VVKNSGCDRGEINDVKFDGLFIAALAALAIGPMPVLAQPNPAPALDPNGYYNPFDPNGYFDRSGQYHPMRPGNPGPAPAPSGSAVPAARAVAPPAAPAPVSPYYQEGNYETACHRGGAVAGTIFPSTGGGLFGGASRGRNGEIFGGVVMGGSLQTAISAAIDCEDQAAAFGAYAAGLNGSVGARRPWRHGDGFGDFTPTREFRRGDLICRDFTETSYREGENTTRKGTACRAADGQWRFD
jgi:surface antigen